MLNEIAQDVHNITVKEGKPTHSFAETVAYCHAGLSKALEEQQKDRPLRYLACNAGRPCLDYEKRPGVSCGSRTYNPQRPDAPCGALNKKPKGVAVEMAGCLIQILDWAAHEGVDMDAVVQEVLEYRRTNGEGAL